MLADDVTSDELMAQKMEDETPWNTVASVLSHQGWLDLIETIKQLSPDSYAALRRDLLTPRTTKETL